MYLPIYLTAALDMSEKIALSGKMILKGMGTVFLVLAVLWAIIALFSVFSSSDSSKESKKEKKVEPKETGVPTVTESPAATPVSVQSDDALIAAICAAIEAYRAEEGLSGLSYRVVSFKRKSGRKSWNGTNEE